MFTLLQLSFLAGGFFFLGLGIGVSVEGNRMDKVIRLFLDK